MKAQNSLNKGLHFTFIPEAHIEAAANRLRFEYQQATGACVLPLDLEVMIWDFLYLHPHHRLSLDLETPLGHDENGDLIAGRTAIEREQEEGRDGGCISIDPSIVGTPLYTFTLGHELGHWILHRTLMIQARCQGNLFSPGTTEILTLQRHVGLGKGEKLPQEEWQANTFAAYFLMPRDELIAEFCSRYGDNPLYYRERRETSLRFCEVFPRLRDYSRCVAGEGGGAGKPPLISVFGVSKEAMAIRLEQLQLVIDHKTDESRLL